MIEKMSNWLTLDEASEYIGLGKTALYELARESKIPSNKVGKKWLFNKSDLDAWIRGNIPIEKFFVSVEANIEENLQLREPQFEGYKHIYDYFANGGDTAIVQIPVGCGKSGLAGLIPFGISNGRVLINKLRR